MTDIVPIEVIAEKIFEIRGQKVMIDADLAALYGVPTKALNQAIRRNPARFPEDFMFALTMEERNELVTKCDRLANLKHSSVMPHALTESGVAMLASVLNSERAALVNVQIVRAFVRLRMMLAGNAALRHALQELEHRVGKNERDIHIALGALQKLLNPPESAKPQRRIGFAP
jgi:hypothetical protein